MKELIKKNWEYTLYEKDTMLVLSVVCGTVALYDINIKLNKAEEDQYCNLGESFIAELAEQIRSSPSVFKSRHIELPKS